MNRFTFMIIYSSLQCLMKTLDKMKMTNIGNCKVMGVIGDTIVK